MIRRSGSDRGCALPISTKDVALSFGKLRTGYQLRVTSFRVQSHAGRSTSAGNLKICWQILHYQLCPYVSAKSAAGLPGRAADFKGIAVGVGEVNRLAFSHHQGSLEVDLLFL